MKRGQGKYNRPQRQYPARRRHARGWQSLDYTDDESEFLLAILAFRDANGRLPTLCEALEVAKSLGWRKEE